MVLSFLRIKKRKIVKKSGLKMLEEITLAEYLLDFFQYYSIQFDLKTEEICMQDGGYIRRKKNSQNAGFSLVYYQTEELNIGQQAFKIWDVINVFKNRYNFVSNYKFARKESILKYLLNPSGEDFSTYLD